MPDGMFDCPHCESTGTCKVADGRSCGTCLREAKVKGDATIVRCEVCVGVGKVEPKTERLKARMPFIVVVCVLAVFYCYALLNATNADTFDQIFPLVGSLTTMIATFYFSKK